MTALVLRVRSPMPVKQLSENLRLHFALSERFIALLILGVVFRLGIHRRNENDVLPVRRPDAAIRSCGNVRDLMRLAIQSAAFGSEVGHPDLSGVRSLRGPNQTFAVRRKPRSLFVVR